jgi:nitrogen fixation protein FixH
MSQQPFGTDRQNAAALDGFSASPPGHPRELKGWMVLVFMIAFFAVIFGVNAFMAHEAISTFGGVETGSAYQAGQTFERDVAMAKAQDAQHWRVDANVTAGADGTALLELNARDPSGVPLPGLTAIATFERPTDRRLDRTMTLGEITTGRFRGNAVIPAGQWDLVIELSHGGERMFRSKNRIMVGGVAQ